MAKYWDKEEIKGFISQDGTKFIRGPFEIDDNMYDYKLIDKDGEDYCTKAQMESWGVELRDILTS